MVTESPVVVVTESPSSYQEYEYDSYDEEDLDDDVEFRSLITKSGKHAEVQFSPDGSVRVVEEGRDPYLLDLKSSPGEFSADKIDDLMNDVIRLIGGGTQEPDPVDQDSTSSDSGAYTHFPSSTPASQLSPPTLEPAGSGHYRSPGDYLNLDAIRQRMRGEQLHHQRLHHQQPPSPQHAEYQARTDTMVTETGFTYEAQNLTGLHPAPTLSVPPKVEIMDTSTETKTDLPDFVDAQDPQIEGSLSPSPPPIQPYFQEPPSEGGTPQVLELGKQEEEHVPPPIYGGGGEGQQEKMEQNQQEKIEEDRQKMENPWCTQRHVLGKGSPDFVYSVP